MSDDKCPTCHAAPDEERDELYARIAELRQDLSDARNGWEAAAEALRCADARAEAAEARLAAVILLLQTCPYCSGPLPADEPQHVQAARLYSLSVEAAHRAMGNPRQGLIVSPPAAPPPTKPTEPGR